MARFRAKMGTGGRMILVTGATGKTGVDVVRGLSIVGAGVKAFVRDEGKAQPLRRPGVEVAVGDLEKPETLAPALRGCDRVFLCSAAGPRQVELQGNLIRAAKEAGVRHVVRMSALGASLDSPVSMLRWHAETEKQLIASGLPWTFLRPHYFMQNVLGFAPSIKAQSAFFLPMKGGRIPLVDTRDIAAVAVEALTGSGHERKIYDVTGPEALSGQDLAQKLSKAAGRTIAFRDVSPEEARKQMRAAGAPDWMADSMVALYGVFAANRAAAVSPVVEQLTGYPARTFDDWARENAASFR
ncbi:MAG TPA: SDR family oxidoreductase [Thermoanaerobaculia bacterium]|nr:SDR family oxidoreductase [Thermoanaerobaculia bacterium]